MPFGAAAILGGASLLGGIIGSNNQADAAQSAARTQANAANNAAQMQAAAYGDISGKLSTYLNTGNIAKDTLANLFGLNATNGTWDANGQFLQPVTNQLGAPPTLSQPGAYNPTPYAMPDFNYQQSPGFAAALSGGVNALQNAGAGRGGALSGNVLRALSQYGTQQANQDYQQNYQNFAQNYQNQYAANNQNQLNQYNAAVQSGLNQFNAGNSNYWNQFNALNQNRAQTINALTGFAGAGQNAAAQTGGFAQQAAGNAGNALIGAGNALAAGQIGAANAQTGGINSFLTALNAPQNNNSLLSSLYTNLFGGGQPNYATGVYNPSFGGGMDYGSSF